MKREFTMEHRKKLSIAAKKRRPSFLGKHHSELTKKRISLMNKLGICGLKGKKHSKETKIKMSKAAKGRVFTKEHIKNLSKAHIGHKMSEESKLKISVFMKVAKKGRNNPHYGKRGNLSHRWRGGLTAKHLLIRGSFEYREWRTAVFERDNYTCIWCGDNKGGNLEADHIKPFSLYPNLRLIVSNGRTLCHSCHMKTDTYGYKLLKNDDSILQINVNP